MIRRKRNPRYFSKRMIRRKRNPRYFSRRSKKFDSTKVTKRETEINSLFVALADVCEGKEIGVVEQALSKLQELTY